MFIYIAIIIAFSFVTVTLIVSGISKYVKPSLHQMKKEVLKLREASREPASKLVPFSQEEVELLSSSALLNSKGNKWRKIISGQINSIYNEALVCFYLRKYWGGRDRKIIYARTSSDEFVFIKKKNLVQLYLNGSPFGKFENETLYFIKNNKAIAWLEGNADQNRAIKTANKRLALLNPSVEAKAPASRAFQFVSSLNESEKKILTAIIIYKLLENE